MDTELTEIGIAGASLDVSFLMDFLPSYLFPNEERTISQWLISGISLGGHATWIILKDGKIPRLLPCLRERISCWYS